MPSSQASATLTRPRPPARTTAGPLEHPSAAWWLTAVAAALAFLVMGATAVALADEGAPRIDEVVASGSEQGGVAKPGGNLRILGRRFVDGPPTAAGEADSVEVRLGGERLRVLQIAWGEVVVNVPSGWEAADGAPATGGLAPGRHELEVRAAGRRSNRVPVELLATAEFDRRFGALEREAGADLEPARERFQRRLDVETFTLEPDPETGQRLAVIGGTAELPDRTSVILQLKLVAPDGGVASARTIEARKERVQDGRFEARFGPFERTFPAGLYLAEATVELGKNPPVRRSLAATITAEEKAAVPLWKKAVLRDREIREVGDRDGLERERETARAHYRDALDLVDDLVRELRAAWGAASRSLARKSDGSVDADRWAALLRAHGIRVADEAAREALRADDRFVASGSHLDPDAWLRWLREEQLATIAALRERLAGWDETWVAPRYPEAALRLRHVVSAIDHVSRRWTAELFAGSGLPVPEDLRSPGDPGVLPAAKLDAAVIAQGRREIARIVGIDLDD